MTTWPTVLTVVGSAVFVSVMPGSDAMFTVAVDWLEVTVLLSGMNSDEQLEENSKAAEESRPHMLTERERGVYPEIVSVFEKAYKIPCTGCNYCMPCPHGVNISGCFAAYNTSYAIGFIPGMMQYATGTSSIHPDEYSGGKNCKKCGVCEKKCPQRIPIMKSLEAVTHRMEPFYLDFAMKLFGKLTK